MEVQIEKDDLKKFSELAVGDSFKYVNQVYIKMATIIQDEYSDYEIKYNAVNLHTGKPCFFEDIDNMSHVNAHKLVKK